MLRRKNQKMGENRRVERIEKIKLWAERSGVELCSCGNLLPAIEIGPKNKIKNWKFRSF